MVKLARFKKKNQDVIGLKTLNHGKNYVNHGKIM